MTHAGSSFGKQPEPGEYLLPGLGQPTQYAPGTTGKLAVMAARAARREPLFYPGDNSAPAEPPALACNAAEARDPSRRELPLGVWYWPARRKYRARYECGLAYVYLGLHDTAAAAARAIEDYLESLEPGCRPAAGQAGKYRPPACGPVGPGLA